MSYTATKHRDIHNMSSLLASLCEDTHGEEVSVEDLLNAVGRRAFGPLLLLLGFVAISPLTIIPGTSWLTAFVTLLVAGQIVLGQSRPWLPKKALSVRFPREHLVAGINKVDGIASKIDRLLQPRLCFLTAPPFVQVIAAICVFAALVTFPLGLVPFGPVLPGLGIMFIGLGLTSRDGIMVLIAGGAVIGAGFLLINVLERIF